MGYKHLYVFKIGTQLGGINYENVPDLIILKCFNFVKLNKLTFEFRCTKV